MTLLTENLIQENRWIQYDVNTNSFVTTDYVINGFNTPARAVSVSTDLDTIMTDASTIARTSRTLSHDPSESQIDSLVVARLSTPLGLQATNPPQPTMPISP